MLPTYITIRYSAVVSAHLKQLFSDHRPLAYLKHEVLFKIPHVKVIRSFRLIYPQFAYGCWFDHNHTRTVCFLLLHTRYILKTSFCF